MSDYVLELKGIQGDLIIDGPLAENRVYAEVLSCLRPRAAMLASQGCAPAVTAAAVLCNSAPIEQLYLSIKSHADRKRLQAYRALWRGAAALCAGSPFS
jgi:hypothetical protein